MKLRGKLTSDTEDRRGNHGAERLMLAVRRCDAYVRRSKPFDRHEIVGPVGSSRRILLEQLSSINRNGKAP